MPKVNLKDFKQKTTKIPLTIENLDKTNFLTKSNIQILNMIENDDIARIYMIGGKSTSKTYLTQIYTLMKMEQDPRINAYGFRKYKYNASDNLGSYASKAHIALRNADFDIKDYQKSTTGFYRLNASKKFMYKNQSIDFGSLENVDATSGGAPSNGGYYGVIIYDEPVVKDDANNPAKIPTKSKWNELVQDIIRNNLDRHNDPNNPKERTIEFYTMNDWGNHPLTLKCMEIIPIDDFINYIFDGYSLHDLTSPQLLNSLMPIDTTTNTITHTDFVKKLISNHTMMKIHTSKEDNEKELWVRRTKFSNPTNLVPKKLNQILLQTRKSLLNEDFNALSIILGLRHEGEIDENMLVYHIPDFNNVSGYQDFIDEGFKHIGEVVYSWDIDLRKNSQLTLTPSIEFIKKGIFENESRIMIDKQIEVKTHGLDSEGKINDLYIKQMVEIMTNHHENLVHEVRQRPEQSSIAVDEINQMYIREIMDIIQPYYLDYGRPFKKHGAYSLIERQKFTHFGFLNKVLFNHIENEALEQDFRVCQRSDYQKEERKTSGTTNYLDRIDSFENSIINHFGLIWNAERKEK